MPEREHNTADSPDDQTEVIDFLSSPASYGGIEPVERHETHGAIVFLQGDRAYKLKRAVRYLYMDYSTIDRRKRMSERELAVNRRTAPELYLEVRPIIRDAAGDLTFGDRETAGAVDWVVVMRRFDQRSLLEQMRRRQELSIPLMAKLAEAIAELHRIAEIRRDFGGAAGISAVIAGDVDVLRTMTDHPFSPHKLERLARLTWRGLDRDGALLDRRRDSGSVRRCHGDLHLNNICLIEGRPLLFDAIEFNEDFSCIDVLYDLAFLLMDLDRHGMRAHANTVLNHYLETTQDYGGLAALPLFLSCRAAIRAHVAVAAARASRHPSAGYPVDPPTTLLDQAIGYLEPTPPRLVVIGGPSGTGKSTLARNIAPTLGTAPGAVILRSDVVRKQMMGVSEAQRLPPAAYHPEVNTRVFGRIAEIAAEALAAGHTVIADAVYGTPEQQEQIATVAAHARVPFDGLWLTAAPALLEQRISERRGDVSDATVEVLRRQLAVIRQPVSWSPIDATGSPTSIAARALHRLLPDSTAQA